VKTVAGKYRNPYRPAYRFRLKAQLIQAGQPTRFVTLQCKESAVDWEGSYYTNQVAEFMGVESGWQWNETVYPTLLRAVRAALSAGI
jgi:hypothetical protein